MIAVRDARPGEIASLEGWSQPLELGGAQVAEMDGRVVGWLAWAPTKLGAPYVFSGTRGMPVLRGIREARAMLASLPRAWCIPNDDKAKRLLALLGWVPAGQIEGVDVMEWRRD